MISSPILLIRPPEINISLTRRDDMIEIDKYGSIIQHSFAVRLIIYLKWNPNTASSCFDCDWPCNVKNRIKYVNLVLKRFYTYLIELLNSPIHSMIVEVNLIYLNTEIILFQFIYINRKWTRFHIVIKERPKIFQIFLQFFFDIFCYVSFRIQGKK